VPVAHAGSWPVEEAVGVALLVAAIGAWFGLRPELPTRRGRRRLAMLVAGLATTGAALVPPVSTAAEQSLTGHMFQHLVLMLVAPPLLVLGEPLGLAAQVSRGSTRRSFALAARRVRRLATTRSFEVGAGAAFVAVVSLWHVPVLYDAAVGSDALHALEHVTMGLAGIAFWLAVLAPRPVSVLPVVPVAMLVVVTFHGAFLGLALVFSSSPWYTALGGRTGDAVLADQQASGAVMWGLGGVITIVAAAVMVGRWLHRAEPSVPASRAGVG
jgi:putative membrane protein